MTLPDKDIPDDVPVPLGFYQAVMVRGNHGWVSGQFPYVAGDLRYTGELGAGLSLEEGIDAARLCALNVLGQLQRALGPRLEQVELCRVDGYIASTLSFLDHPAVLDGASRVFVERLGERGHHARAVLPVTHLPRRAPVELVVSFRLA